MSNRMTTSNPKICNFYQNNSAIDFEQVNLCIIDFFEKIYTKSSGNMSVSNDQLQHMVGSYLKSSLPVLNEELCNNACGFIAKTVTPLVDKTNQMITDILDMSKHYSRLHKIDDNFTFCNKAELLPKINVVLNQIYPTADVVPLRNINADTDLQLYTIHRTNKHKILFGVIDCEENVSETQSSQFIDIGKSFKSHGIFVSQNSGFSYKPNYHIEISNGYVYVFVHRAQCSESKIKIAVDIVDNLSQKLKELQHSENISQHFTIEKTVLEEISREYIAFVSQKESIIHLLKENQKQLTGQLEDLQFNVLDKYLYSKLVNLPKTPKIHCTLCNNYNAHNLKALAAHKRGCERKLHKT